MEFICTKDFAGSTRSTFWSNDGFSKVDLDGTCRSGNLMSPIFVEGLSCHIQGWRTFWKIWSGKVLFNIVWEFTGNCWSSPLLFARQRWADHHFIWRSLKVWVFLKTRFLFIFYQLSTLLHCLLHLYNKTIDSQCNKDIGSRKRLCQYIVLKFQQGDIFLKKLEIKMKCPYQIIQIPKWVFKLRLSFHCTGTWLICEWQNNWDSQEGDDMRRTLDTKKNILWKLICLQSEVTVLLIRLEGRHQKKALGSRVSLGQFSYNVG